MIEFYQYLMRACLAYLLMLLVKNAYRSLSEIDMRFYLRTKKSTTFHYSYRTKILGWPDLLDQKDQKDCYV